MRWAVAAAATAGVAVAAAVLVLTPTAAPVVADLGEVPLAGSVAAADGRPGVVPVSDVDSVSLPVAAAGAGPVSTSVDSGAGAGSHRPTAPGRLTIPTLGITAPVIPVSTGRDGVLHPPADIRTVGRWTGGALPGDPVGTVVITGHLDSRTQGRGALYSLGTARPGQEVSVGGVAYEVVAVRTYGKQALPQDIWTPGGPPRLILITCGGRFTGGHYESNTVVYALPV